MTRPDEIAALADRLKDHSEAARAAAKCSMPFGKMRRGWNALADDIDEALSRLSATSPGDGVRALEAACERFANISCGRCPAPPGTANDPVAFREWAMSYADAGYMQTKAALAPAEKAGDELKVACASCKKIPGPHCQRPTCAFREYIDTRAVKTILTMTPSELSVIPASAVESGREMVRQAVAATPTPPSADVAAYIDALTPSANTKSAYISEFHFTVPDGNRERRVTVPWDTIKQIMLAIREMAIRSYGDGASS